MRIVRAAMACTLVLLLLLVPGAAAQDDLDLDALLDEISDVTTEAEAPAETPEASGDLDALLGEVEEATNGVAPAAVESPAEASQPPADMADEIDAFLGEPETPTLAESNADDVTVADVLGDMATEEELAAPEAAGQEEAMPDMAGEASSDELDELMGGIEEMAAEEAPEIVSEMPAAPTAEEDLLDDLLGETEEAAPEAGMAEEAEPFEFEDLMGEEAGAEEMPAAEVLDETGEMPGQEAEMGAEAEAADEEAEQAQLAESMGISLDEAAEMLAKQEEVRLQAREVNALKSLAAGYAALGNQKYNVAVKEFEKALDMPVRDKTQESLARARAGYADANFSIARDLYKNRTDLDKALEHLEKALREVPDHPSALRLKAKVEKVLARPVRPVPVKKREEYLAKTATIEEMLAEGKQYFDVKDYNQAEDIFEQVLLRDEYNKDAMRFMKKIGDYRYQLRTTERDATAADMMQQVRDTWNPPLQAIDERGESLPRQATRGAEETGQEKLRRKMQSIIIPSLEFRTANITDVINFLVDASIAGDEEGAGVNIILNLALPGQEVGTGTSAPPPAPTDFSDFGGDFSDFGGDFGAGTTGESSGGGNPALSSIPTITLNLRRVTLLDALRYITEVAGLKFRVEQSAVIITPAGYVSGEVFTRMYPVQPSILDVIIERQDVERDSADFQEGFSDFGSRTTVKRSDVKDFFEKAGVPFPVGTTIAYNPNISKLIVANTAENHDKLQRVLDEINLTPFQVEIEARFVEINQSDLQESGLEWLLTDDYEVATKDGLGPVSTRERVQVNANADDGGITRGLRFFNLDTAAGAIAPLSSALQTTTTAPVGNILSFSSVLTNPELTVILHALSQSGSSDLLSAPRVTTRTGQQAVIQVVQEIIYPTEFEQDITLIDKQVETAGGGTQTVQNQFVTVTPGAFETRPIGVILNVTPTVAPDGFTIDLALSPEVAELVDWINYGSVQEGQEINIPQPVFASRNVSTTISIWDGQTVVMGGLIREELVTINDKVPILGDIPFVGRLFRNEGERSIKRNLIIFVTARLVRPDGRPLNRAEDIARDTGLTSTAAGE